ncbi:CvfB family protein [Pediococcus acidilactici]|uniref:CvfB family protein n=1 Tax=Pediococcus acidilactici TaxID=1254 RepID=UPI001C701CC2|nr:S1-like domain-containing RNA-binding protein [Pediococcus acidilactici]MBW9300396.1 DNA-binding protein [Pediococcus acidilactici]
METLLGKEIQAKVIDENDQFYFAQAEDGLTYRIDKSEIKKPLKKDSNFSGFAYENANHERQMTREAPKATTGRYGWGTVVKVRKDLGVFVDIGLNNKDVVVSLDELPTETKLWPHVDDQLLVCLTVDNKERMWAQPADSTVFKAISVRANKKMINQNVSATAYRLKLAGTLVITDQFQLGFIHPSERDREPRLGEKVQARVIGIHPDGTLNLSLKPRNYEALGDDAAMILALLQHRSDRQLPFNDHSNPSDIKEHFGISKSRFKMAIGHLLKAGVIEQTADGIVLKEQ